MVVESQVKRLNKIQKDNFELHDGYTNSVQAFLTSGRTDSNALMENYKKLNQMK